MRMIIGAKLHGLKITGSDIDYHGSITLDPEYCKLVGIYPLEYVDVWNKNNGSRLSTYVIYGEKGSRCCILNGAASRTCQRGDEIIIASNIYIHENEITNIKPIIMTFKEDNQIDQILQYVVDGINAQKLCRPLVPVSYNNAVASAKFGLHMEKAQTPRTAKSVERRIREQLTLAHRISAGAARHAYTFEELGLNSLVQLNLLNELKHIFAIDIPLTATWEVNTIANLSVLIFTIIQEKNTNL